MNEPIVDAESSGLATDYSLEEYSLLEELPIDMDTLSLETRGNMEVPDGYSNKYLVLKDDDGPVGFVILSLPEGEGSDHCELSYRYVFPDHRRQGLGTRLRTEAYTKAQELGYRWLDSGINEVYIIDNEGNITENISPKRSGGWRSYASMNRSKYRDGTYPRHLISSVSVGMNGRVDYAFRTDLAEGTQEPSLPDTAQELFKASRGIALPVSESPQEMLQRSRETGTVNYADGEPIPVSWHI